MNRPYTAAQQWQIIWENGRQERLRDKIQTVFEDAIEDRAPKNRPPGKAGLRAEKAYYRLLYLEDVFRALDFKNEGDAKEVPIPWETMERMLSQLKDIPELQEEIRAGIAAAMDAVQDRNGI